MTTPARIPSPDDHAEMPKRIVGRRLVRTCSCGKPWPCEQSRWKALRTEIELYRELHNDMGSALEDEGKDGTEAFARADELAKVLATMDRMEAGQ